MIFVFRLARDLVSASQEESDVEVRQILDLYRRVYEELLAVPVVPGTKVREASTSVEFCLCVNSYSWFGLIGWGSVRHGAPIRW